MVTGTAAARRSSKAKKSLLTIPHRHRHQQRVRAADVLSRTELKQEPALAFVKVFRNPVLLGGRYRKLKRMVPQSPWLVGHADDDDKRTVTTSVQARAALPSPPAVRR